MAVLFMQTSDSNFYYEMLKCSSKTFRNYCFARGIFYEQYVGEKCQNMPWKAAYNRIYMLRSLLENNFSGWAFYLDADCYVKDPDFDVFKYLSDKGKYGGIFSGYLYGVPYNINSGGFAINFDHPIGRQIVSEYIKEYEKLPKEDLDNAINWEVDVPEDQYMLHVVLKKFVDQYGLKDYILFEEPNKSYVNTGPFIAQNLRAHGNVASRSQAIKEIADRYPVFNDFGGRSVILNLHTSHPSIKTAEHGKRYSIAYTDGNAEKTALWGPYVPLNQGAYELLMYVYVSGSVENGKIDISMDIASDHGKNIISQKNFYIEKTGPSLLKIPFSLNETVSDLETRVYTKKGHKIYFPRIVILS